MSVKASPESYVRPLIPALFGLIAGIVVGLYVPGCSCALVGVLGCAGGLAITIRFRKSVRLLPLLLFFFLGYWSLQPWVTPRTGTHQVNTYIDDMPWHILGIVTAPPEHFPDRSRFILQVKSLTRQQVRRPATGSIRVTVKGEVGTLDRGDMVACLARLKEIRNFNNPGGFDYERYMRFKGVSATAFIAHPALIADLGPTRRGWWSPWVDHSRRAIIRFIESVPPSDARGILKAVVVGDRHEISAQNRRLFSRVGISHLLAISGLHVGIVATFSFWIFRALLARSRKMLMAAWVTRGAALLSIVPVIIYGLLAGMSPSTQRAVVMVTTFLLATLLERQGDKFNTLAVAALVILLIDPTALFQVSFQLSFSAVFAILYMLDRLTWASYLRSAPSTLRKKMGLLLLVSAAAILGTLPVSLYYFNETSLVGLISNAVMVPVLTFLVVPLGLMVVLFLPLMESLALFLLNGAIFVVSGCLDLAALFARIPFAATKTVTPSLLEIGLYYLLLGCLLNLRRRRWIRGVLAVTVLVALLDIGFWYRQRFCRSDLQATFIDVGQGSALLLELPKGHCMLVDGGGFYGNLFDVGERVVAPFLWRKKIATVETLVLSHPNADHLNGLLFIARHFNVQEIWSNQEPTQYPAHVRLKEILKDENIRSVGLHGGGPPREIDGVRFTPLSPPVGFMDKKARQPWRTVNNNSVVMKVCFGHTSFLLCGDIEAEAERELVQTSCDRLASDVLLVPHHGSKTSSTPQFLDCVHPSVAVITAGWKNVFGFPHDRIVAAYRDLGCQTLRTDHNGAIRIRTDGTDTTIETFLPRKVWTPVGNEVDHRLVR